MKKNKMIVFIEVVVGIVFFLVLWLAFVSPFIKDIRTKGLFSDPNNIYFGKDDSVAILKSYDNAELWFDSEDANNNDVEVKVYYYLYEQPFLYTINKWNRYTVLDVESRKVVIQTEDISKLQPQHREIFEHREFEDIRWWDWGVKDDAYEIGDGTLHLTKRDSAFYLECEKDYVENNIMQEIEGSIKRYYLDDRYLYLIDSAGTYYVVDMQTYEVKQSSDQLESLNEMCQKVFEDTNLFITEHQMLYELT